VGLRLPPQLRSPRRTRPIRVRVGRVPIRVRVGVPLGIVHTDCRPQPLRRGPHLVCLREVGQQVRRPLARLAVERHQLGHHGVEAGPVGVEGRRDPVVAIHNPEFAVIFDKVHGRERARRSLARRIRCQRASQFELRKGFSGRKSPPRWAAPATAVPGSPRVARTAGEFTRRGQSRLRVQLVQACEWLFGPASQASTHYGIAPGPGLIGGSEDGSERPGHGPDDVLVQRLDDMFDHRVFIAATKRPPLRRPFRRAGPQRRSRQSPAWLRSFRPPSLPESHHPFSERTISPRWAPLHCRRGFHRAWAVGCVNRSASGAFARFPEGPGGGTWSPATTEARRRPEARGRRDRPLHSHGNCGRGRLIALGLAILGVLWLARGIVGPFVVAAVLAYAFSRLSARRRFGRGCRERS